MKKFWMTVALLSAFVLHAVPVRAEYPDRPIRLVVPFAPGGANDSVARLLAERLGKVLEQSIVVENRPGGGTIVGTAAVASAAPDGYTLLLVSPALVINPYINKSLPYRTLEDFTPISQITRSAYVLVTAPGSSFETVKDFVRLAKSPADEFSFASSGTGSVPHLAGQLLATMSGEKGVHIPYQGGGPAMIGVIRGDVDVYFSSIAGARSLIESKRVRPLAVSSERRVHALPDVPTVAEAGLAGFAVDGWYGIEAPAKLPPAITAKLSGAVLESLKDPQLVDRLEQEGEEVVGGTPEEFARLLRRDVEKYRTLVASAGLQPR
jgi:tripartite-type tricarboxylate transporter receptor subunit TctC